MGIVATDEIDAHSLCRTQNMAAVEVGVEPSEGAALARYLPQSGSHWRLLLEYLLHSSVTLDQHKPEQANKRSPPPPCDGARRGIKRSFCNGSPAGRADGTQCCNDQIASGLN